LLKVARFKERAMPEDLIYRPDRGLDRSQIGDLLTCEWIARRQNLVLTGSTGTGKTWIACALGMQAARSGRSVLYHRASLLLEALEIAHADGSISRLRGLLAKAELLIIDDFGLTPLTARSKSDLLELLDARLGTGSTVVAGQLPIKSWHDFIADPALADAILDRLIHSAHKVQLKGESMRKFTTRGSRSLSLVLHALLLTLALVNTLALRGQLAGGSWSATQRIVVNTLVGCG